MKRPTNILPILYASAFITLGEIQDFPPGLMAWLGLGMAVGLLPLMIWLERRWPCCWGSGCPSPKNILTITSAKRGSTR